MLYTLRFFSSQCSLFHNANLFGSSIIHILYTGCAKIKKKNNSGAKGLIPEKYPHLSLLNLYDCRENPGTPAPHRKEIQVYLYQGESA